MQEDEEKGEFAAKTRKVREDSRDGVRERKEKQMDKDGK